MATQPLKITIYNPKKMKPYKIGYVRVSTQEQNTFRQEVMMEQLYIDKASGKNADRPEMRRMLTYISIL